MPPVIVTGIKPSSNSPPVSPRLEWDTFKNSDANMTLFIRALDNLMKETNTDVLSYYHIAGIHGRPFESWDKAESPGTNGYCHHRVPTFPTWHRPYLALLEQALAKEFPSIIAKFKAVSTGAAYALQLEEKAKTWRLPYWDWAKKGFQFPVEFTQKDISIWDPSGSKRDWPNMLFCFPRNPNRSWGFYMEFFEGDGNTTRSDLKTINRNLEMGQLRQGIMSLFQFAVSSDPTIPAQSNWNQFSNTTWMKEEKPQKMRGNLNSLEAVHNTIHNAVGGSMQDAGFAAFDPIFWLHHCNVDRLFALYQGIYPNDMIGTSIDKKYGPTTDLIPFRTETKYATSVTCWNTSVYGYTYPEILNAKLENLSDDLRKAVTALYSDASKKISRQIQLPKAVPLKLQSQSMGAQPKVETVVGTSTDQQWIANIMVEQFAFKGSGQVSVFLCAPEQIPADPKSWLHSPSYISSLDVFALSPADAEGCTNCKDQEQNHVLVTGTVFLTDALIERGIPLSGNAPIEYLTNNLQWRCVNSQDNLIPNDQAAGLMVVVQSAPYTEDEFGLHGSAWTIHESVTQR